MSDLSHVDSRLWPLFERPPIDRIRYARRDVYVPYPRAKAVLSEVDHLVHGERSERPECLLIVGEPGVGKSTVLDVVERTYPCSVNEATKLTQRPVVRVNVPGDIDLRYFYQRILKKLQIPFGESDRPSSLGASLHQGLVDAETRVLIVDELHNFFITGPQTLAMHMAVLRDLTNTPKVSLLCAGTNLAENCIKADAQLEERFDVYHLVRWTESIELRNFLASLERRLPLRIPSNLSGPIMLPLLARLSTGNMRRMVRMIQRAATEAVLSGTERITETGLRKKAQEMYSGHLGAPGTEAPPANESADSEIDDE